MCRVWGLTNIFSNEKLYFMRDIRELNCLPKGLEPSTKAAAKLATKACAEPSAKSAAKPAT